MRTIANLAIFMCPVAVMAGTVMPDSIPGNNPVQLTSAEGEHVAESADSVDTRVLDEVTVEADRVMMMVGKLSYATTRQQRNASVSGVMLLHQLAIPQLKVNPLSGSVTTDTGEMVTFFIDGVPATENDVADLNTRDVMRVEVLDYPSDPRFRNAAHVVNYIMLKYEYGGYTKLTTTGMLLSCFSSYNTLNSKMVYKSMTFDARAYYQYSNGAHNGSDDVQRFRLPGYGDVAPEGITRSSVLDASKFIIDRPSASFRAMYQGGKTQFSSTVDWSFEGKRTDRRSGRVLYSPDLFNTDVWSYDCPTRKNTVRWSNEFFQLLPANWALTASFGLTYDHNNQTQKRTEGDVALRDLTPDYSMQMTTITINEHRRLNVTLAYTFGYGRKVERSNELQGTSGGSSSIR